MLSRNGPRPRARVRRGLTTSLLGLVSLIGGCANAGELASGSKRMEERTPTMQESREDAVQATRDVVSTLEALDLRPKFAEGDYSSCAGPSIRGHLGWKDDGGASQFVVRGRLDLPADRTGSESFAVQLRDSLESGGWEPDSHFPETIDGIQNVDHQWIVRARRGHLDIVVNTYATEQLVLFKVLGPCLPTTWEEREKYLEATAERVDIGASDGS